MRDINNTQDVTNFLHNFDSETTQPGLVREYYRRYLKSGTGNLFFSMKNHHARDRIKVIRGGKCQICKYDCGPALQIHHVIPRNHNGSSNERNLSLLCANCHCLVHNGIDTGDMESAKTIFTISQYRKFEKLVNMKRCW